MPLPDDARLTEAFLHPQQLEEVALVHDLDRLAPGPSLLGLAGLGRERLARTQLARVLADAIGDAEATDSADWILLRYPDLAPVLAPHRDPRIRVFPPDVRDLAAWQVKMGRAIAAGLEVVPPAA